MIELLVHLADPVPVQDGALRGVVGLLSTDCKGMVHPPGRGVKRFGAPREVVPVLAGWQSGGLGGVVLSTVVSRG